MGNAAFYWFPNPGPLRVLDLGIPASQVQPVEVRREVTAEALTGAVTTVRFGARMRARILIELIDSHQVRRGLEDLVNHLKRGGLCSFTEDTDATWAGYTVGNPNRGFGQIALQGNMFENYAGGIQSPIGDEIIVQGPSPLFHREGHTVVGVGANNLITLGEEITSDDYLGGSFTFVRSYRFWPFLRIPKEGRNSAFLTSDRRITEDLDITLEEPPDVLSYFADSADRVFMGADYVPGGMTLEDPGSGWDLGDGTLTVPQEIRGY
jgi:hypothetical protein